MYDLSATGTSSFWFFVPPSLAFLPGCLPHLPLCLCSCLCNRNGRARIVRPGSHALAFSCNSKDTARAPGFPGFFYPRSSELANDFPVVLLGRLDRAHHHPAILLPSCRLHRLHLSLFSGPCRPPVTPSSKLSVLQSIFWSIGGPALASEPREPKYHTHLSFAQPSPPSSAFPALLRLTYLNCTPSPRGTVASSLCFSQHHFSAFRVYFPFLLEPSACPSSLDPQAEPFIHP